MSDELSLPIRLLQGGLGNLASYLAAQRYMNFISPFRASINRSGKDTGRLQKP